MGGVWWDIEVQVHFFLIKSCMNPALLDMDGEVHEVAFVPTWCEFLCQSVEFTNQSLKLSPEPFVGCWVGMA